MKNKLQQLFPMIKTREEVQKIINDKPGLLTIFNSWKPEQQEEFLSFVTGASGTKILYDSFFKEIFNPETVPGRLNQLLSLLLGKKVQILEVLPPDNSRLADETSLVIMDIVVKLEDGAIVDVEVQKIGYLFPGQRSACYSADLLLRQYKKAREECNTGNKLDSEKKKLFSYKNMHTVYTIVFFESSPRTFKAFPDQYIHKFQQKSDTGLELELLQKYIFLPLDIYTKSLQNKGISNDIDAWLAFLSSDKPEVIEALIGYAPIFKDMYRHLYEICENVEGVMNMFSKELQILDRNTVQLMIDEMQDDINRLSASNAEQRNTITEQSNMLTEKDNMLVEKDNTIAEQNNTIAELKARLVQFENPDDKK